MKLKNFWEWLDDFDQPTECNWYRVARLIIWTGILTVGLGCWLYMFSIFGEPQ